MNFKTFNMFLYKFEGTFFNPIPASLTFNQENDIIVCYTDTDTKNLHIFVADKSLNEKIDKNLNITAVALDLKRIPSGYVILCKDLDNQSHFYMYAVDSKLNFLWQRNIVNRVQSTNIVEVI